jgi:GNAT superfamily N-acetyltransferase
MAEGVMVNLLVGLRSWASLERERGVARAVGLARDTWRREGGAPLLWRALAKCLSPLGSFGTATLYEKDLSHPVVEVRSNADVTITEAAGSDIEQVLALAAESERLSVKAVADVVAERLRRGARCFVAKAGGEVVHYNWVAFRWAETLPIGAGGHFIVLNDDEAACINAHTVPAWRGRAIHPAVLHTMLLWLRAAGVRRAYTVVGNENKRSWKTHERLAWTVRGTILYFRPRRMDKAWVLRTRGIPSRFVAVEPPRIA